MQIPEPVAQSSAAEVERSDALFGGVYGTVLASALLASIQREGASFTPFYDALWIAVTAASSALAHGYARHMSTHRKQADGHRWHLLAHTLAGEWPLVAASLPTVLLLLLAGATRWREGPCTLTALGINAAMLFGWGVLAAQRMGYRRRDAILIGVADSALGLAIVAANAVIK